MTPAPHRPPDEGALVCSSRGCQQPAAWVLRWNNPKLHTPDRRKEWLACAEHREALSAFLQVRGFLRETVPLPERGPGAGSPGDPPAGRTG